MSDSDARPGEQQPWPLDPQQPPAEPSRQPPADDSHRQLTLDTLTQAWRIGQLNRVEFASRSQRAISAESLAELDELTTDLGGVSGYLPTQQADARRPARQNAQLPVHDSFSSDDTDSRLPARLVAPDTPASHVTVAVMSGPMRAGRWVVPRNHVVIGSMGGATIDLRDAVFTHPEVTITCIAVMGGIEVIVPPEMDVRANGIGFMGFFGWEKVEQAHQQRTPAPDDPTVIINGLGFWGGVAITRKGFKKRDNPKPLADERYHGTYDPSRRRNRRHDDYRDRGRGGSQYRRYRDHDDDDDDDDDDD